MSGGGIAILPGYMHFGDYQNRIVRVLDDWTGRLIELHAIFPSHRGATPKVRAFLDFLVIRLAHRFDEPVRRLAAESYHCGLSWITLVDTGLGTKVGTNSTPTQQFCCWSLLDPCWSTLTPTTPPAVTA